VRYTISSLSVVDYTITDYFSEETMANASATEGVSPPIEHSKKTVLKPLIRDLPNNQFIQ
jgi:hypothetical protein